MGMPVMTMDSKVKGLFGYIQDVREEYPPLHFDQLRDTTQTSIQVANAATRWKATNAQYDFTAITVLVSLPDRVKPAEISILSIRPYK